jgi:uncharacterized repeat protein (TIGR03803 family)
MTNSLSGNRLRAACWAVTLTTLLVLTAVPTSAAQAADFKTLYTFTGADDGVIPISGVIDVDGTLYGTTRGGGDFQSGTVFKLTTTGQETVLYSFTGTGGDGFNPVAPLIMDAAGNLYGTTGYGGLYGACGSNGCGTVFKIDPAGHETVLYRFTGGADGQYPNGVIRDPQGNLYGTTSYGGINCSGAIGYCGTVFKLDTAGALTVLHTFTGPPDGAQSAASLIRDARGNLYGTTFYGGNNPGGANGPCGLGGCGTVFKVDTSGNETVLYAFCPMGGICADGIWPAAALIRDRAGNFYGTAEAGTASSWGTVFKLSKSGQMSVLYSFTGGGDGGLPEGALVRDVYGTLYGTTYFGGLFKKACDSSFNGCGVVFKLTATGQETVLHSFNGADGGNPTAGLASDKRGNLFGTSTTGYAYGNVFELTLPRQGTTGISFNGTAANFVVHSNTYLTATVPQGATTGYVTVTTNYDRTSVSSDLAERTPHK